MRILTLDYKTAKVTDHRGREVSDSELIDRKPRGNVAIKMLLRLGAWILLFVILYYGAKWNHTHTYPPIIETAEALSFDREVKATNYVFNTGRINEALQNLLPKADPMDKLAMAVAMHETKNCTLGVGATHLNCFGIRKWNGHQLDWARYNSKKEAYIDFKEIWGRMYGTTTPTLANARRWSGDDRAVAWHNNVTHFIKTL